MALYGDKYSHTVALIETDAEGAVADLRARCAAVDRGELADFKASVRSRTLPWALNGARDAVLLLGTFWIRKV